MGNAQGADQPGQDDSRVLRNYEDLCRGYDSKTGARQITVKEVKKLINSGDDVLFLDTRGENEHAVSTIAGVKCAPTLLPVSIGLLTTSFDSPAPTVDSISKDCTCITFCTAGLRSGYAAVKLEKQWSRKVCSLHGGIIAWSNAGGALVVPETGAPTEQVHTFSSNWAKYLVSGDGKRVAVTS